MILPLVIRGDVIGMVELKDEFAHYLEKEEVFYLSGALKFEKGKRELVELTVERIPAVEGVRHSVFTGFTTEKDLPTGDGRDSDS